MNVRAYANRHPMQLLGPPEKVALCREISAHSADGGYGNALHTGCHTPRRTIQAFCLRRAIVPVGIREHLFPTGPRSYNRESGLSSCNSYEGANREEGLQVVSKYGDVNERPRRNGQLFVNLPRNTHDGFRKGQHSVFQGHSLDFAQGRVDSQGFLCGVGNWSGVVSGYTGLDKPSPQRVGKAWS